MAAAYHYDYSNECLTSAKESEIFILILSTSDLKNLIDLINSVNLINLITCKALRSAFLNY